MLEHYLAEKTRSRGWWIRVAGAFVFAQVVILYIANHLFSTTGETLKAPDAVFPYNPVEVSKIINSFSHSGRGWYIACTLWDMGIYIGLYLLFLSGIIAAALRFSQLDRSAVKALLYLPTLTGVCDWLETSLLLYMNLSAPISSQWSVVKIEQFFSTTKWLAFFCSLATILLLFGFGLGKNLLSTKTLKTA